jgi:tetratricopeptide (TPR) repeat protein
MSHQPKDGRQGVGWTGWLAALILSVGAPLLACGLWSPNRLFSNAGAPLLAAPTVSFAQEIAVMKLARATHQSSIATNSYFSETTQAELRELQEALRQQGRTGAEIKRIVEAHAQERAALEAAVLQAQSANAWAPSLPTNRAVVAAGRFQVTPGLPGEFADYFAGAVAWHEGATNQAVAAWERLLQRPPHERRFRSTWAAFMLGKARWETHPRQGAASFQLTRALATNGFPDAIGLAAASLGWEARIELRRERFARAIDLYLEQLAGGDATATLSLWFTAERALKQQARSLVSLARHPRAQRVITAYLIAGGWRDQPVDIDGPVKETFTRLLDRQPWISAPATGWHTLAAPALLWLEAVESAGVQDVESAEKLALAAYQSGNFSHAHRWLARAANQPAARWLKAKLALHDGKLDQAAALLASLAREFPVAARTTGAVHSHPPERPDDEETSFDETRNPHADRLPPTSLFERMWVDWRPEGSPNGPHHALGELGALHLARREYTEALDALLRAGYWHDAFYVADRVLTLDELQRYIDQAWPAPAVATNASNAATLSLRLASTPDDAIFPTLILNPSDWDRSPRDWLGWRLVRAKRLTEARRYLRSVDRAVVEVYREAREAGADQARPKAERAEVLWQAAQTVMASQTRVFTPPAETDWHISGGMHFTSNPPVRFEPPIFGVGRVLLISRDEEDRVRQTAATNTAWYYRFIAADLAWEAVTLMPNQDATTAHRLWLAGTWLKNVAPEVADRFYKALVRRCGRTALGREADRKRWFPATAL